jgi:hypothetical protein
MLIAIHMPKLVNRLWKRIKHCIFRMLVDPDSRLHIQNTALLSLRTHVKIAAASESALMARLQKSE